MEYFIVDVFCHEKYSGNQLAVVLLDKEIPDTRMQDIASEFHFSETTFILKYTDNSAGYNVRIFTPAGEVPFAGHPTLGTAYIIGTEMPGKFQGKIDLNLKAGKIPVTFMGNPDNGILWMRQREPEFGQVYEAGEVAKIINLGTEEIDMNYPVQEVSTGLPFMIIPLKTLNSVKKASINMACYREFFRDADGRPARPVFIFCPVTYDKGNQINCRMFADIYGVPEDPATGSANGCLAGYLVKHGYFKTGGIDIKVEQGYEICRKSLLYLKAGVEDGKITVNVGGKVVKTAQGRLV
jgi:trans-2,3-dihydro-3-hydroxyanthranilate isomerase